MFAAAEIAFCILLGVSGAVLCLGIVWYERNVLPDSKRTLINRLISYQVSMLTNYLHNKKNLPLMRVTFSA